MGSTRWSDAHYTDRATLRAVTGKPTFAYDHDTHSKPVHMRAAHDSLKPFGVKMRECFDSDAHPTSHAVAVLLDVTGSMGKVPRIMQEALPKLMGLLTKKGYLEHPAILTAGVGDATCDAVPLQVGQFESGIEIENDLTNLFLEGGGGGQQTESYELAAYFMARHTSIDCWNKRSKKGYLFFIGDEAPYANVKKHEVTKVIGDNLEGNISLETIFAELKQRYEVFYVMPKMTNNFGDASVLAPWKNLLGQNVLMLDEPSGICELIASTIGLAEGYDLSDIGDHLTDTGSTAGVVSSVSRALSTLADGKGKELQLTDSGKPSGMVKI